MRSEQVTEGPARAPHRSLLRALGISAADAGRPLIGVANSYNELIPGHMHLRTLAEQVKFGVWQAGGIPLEFNVIGVCDGIAMNHEGMNYSLVSRETIADSIEIMVKGHGLDGVVLMPNCDKVVPGMVMGAARLDVPAVVISGGPMLAGDYRGKRVDLKDVFEAVGTYFRGGMSADDLTELEESACPTCGSCAGLFTANSMSCLTEVLGLALPGDATIPAPYSARLALARKTGAQAVAVARNGWGARRFLTVDSLRNALALDAALGCSTNTVLHLEAIAREVGVELPLQTFNEVSARVPHIVKLSPSGPDYMEDLHRAGGIMAVLSRLAEGDALIDGSVPTISGGDLASQYTGVVVRDPAVIRPLAEPHHATGGLGHPVRQPGAQGLCGQGSRGVARDAGASGPRAGLRGRGDSGRGDREERDRRRLRGRHPQRRPQGRPRHARDAHADLGLGGRRARRPGWRSSPTAASAARAGGPASATWLPKPTTAVPSRSCAKGTSSPSTSPNGASASTSATPSLPKGWLPGKPPCGSSGECWAAT